MARVPYVSRPSQTVENNGDFWVIQILNENGLVEDTYREDTSKTVNSDEQRIANLLSKLPGVTLGSKSPRAGGWLQSHDVQNDDSEKVLSIIMSIVSNGIADNLGLYQNFDAHN